MRQTVLPLTCHNNDGVILLIFSAHGKHLNQMFMKTMTIKARRHDANIARLCSVSLCCSDGQWVNPEFRFGLHAELIRYVHCENWCSLQLFDDFNHTNSGIFRGHLAMPSPLPECQKLNKNGPFWTKNPHDASGVSNLAPSALAPSQILKHATAHRSQIL